MDQTFCALLFLNFRANYLNGTYNKYILGNVHTMMLVLLNETKYAYFSHHSLIFSLGKRFVIIINSHKT